MKNKLMLFLILTLLGRLFGQRESAASPEDKKVFEINYLSAENVYLKGGRASGLKEGDRLGILRDNKDLIAAIEVVFLADHSTSCKILRANQKIEVSDVAVLFTQNGDSQQSLPDEWLLKSTRNTPERTTERKASVPFARLSGSASLQHFHLEDQTVNGLDFSQTTFRINAVARKLWGKDYNFRVRTRMRRNQRARDYLANNIPASEFRNRVYELSFGYDNRNALINFRVGRIYSMPLSGIGNVDGGQFQLNLSRKFRMGILVGSQPDRFGSGVQPSLQKYGLYLNYASGDFRRNVFATTLAAVAEYRGSTVSREFLYLQNSFGGGGRLSIFQMLELDINRNWREERAGQSFTISNFFLSTRYRFSEALFARLIFDNRQNYYTIEFIETDDFFFDDSIRTGLRANVSLRLPGNFTLYGEAGARWWEKENTISNSFAAGLSGDRFLFSPLSINLFGSMDSDLLSEGFTAGGQLEWRFVQGHRLNFSYFKYNYTISAVQLDRRNDVYRLGAYWMWLRHIFLSGQFEYARGDDLEGPRLSLEIGYLF